MRKDPEILKKRREFVKDYVENHSGTPITAIVNEIANDKLFCSEATVWNDLKNA